MRKFTITGAIVSVLLVAFVACRVDDKPAEQKSEPLRVGISAYQDLAMLTTYKSLGLDTKYGISVDLVTLDWEKIIPSLASAGRTVDVGFGSLIEFLTKYQNINTQGADPLVYVFPMYVFKGGGFVSFNKAVPNLDEHIPPSPELVKNFFAFKIGAQKNSMFDMLLFSVSERAGIPRNSVHIIDTTMSDGLLAAEHGSLDAAAAGLTQRNEALRQGGRIVLTMDKFGFADLTGLIAKKSTVTARRSDIEKLVHIWFDSVNFVYSDLDHNLTIPMAYLAAKSSTKYTIETYKDALEAEYLPRTVSDANRDLIAADGKFSIGRISKDVIGYLVKLDIVKTAPPVPEPLVIKP